MLQKWKKEILFIALQHSIADLEQYIQCHIQQILQNVYCDIDVILKNIVENQNDQKIAYMTFFVKKCFKKVINIVIIFLYHK